MAEHITPAAAVIGQLQPRSLSRHDALMHDLADFLDSASNALFDDGRDTLSHQADSLFIRVRRELEG